MTISSGTTIAQQFVIKELLKQGSSSAVYRAEDLNSSGFQEPQEVALKILLRSAASDRDRRNRFFEEFIISKEISNPNVIKVFEYFDQDEQPFFSMEFLAGQTLEEWSSRDSRTFSELIDIISQITSGLQAIHENGVIHRDIKSSNILITHLGGVKIIDFGVAERGGELRRANTDLVGSPQSIAPEIWKGQIPTPQSDLYALGVIFFELCTQRLPIEAEIDEQFMFKHLTSIPPRVDAITSLSPRWFSDLTAKLLDKDPIHRPSSAQTVLHCIQSSVLEEKRAERRGRGSVPSTISFRKVLITAFIFTLLLVIWRLAFISHLQERSVGTIKAE